MSSVEVEFTKCYTGYHSSLYLSRDRGVRPDGLWDALKGSMGHYDKKWCCYCGSDEHNVDHCPKTWGGQANLYWRRCDYCGSKEHYLNECPKLR